MEKPVEMPSSVQVLLWAGVALLAFHVLTNGRYGFHRDELQTIDDARHLDWGYVAYPPVTPLIGRLELVVFGVSLRGLRFFSSVAVSAAMVFAGLMARELGGGLEVALLAAAASAISPVALIQGAVFQYVSFDYLWGVAATYFLVRLLKSDNPRWWVMVGAVLGLGMETRYTIGFLALGMATAVMLTPARRYLKSRWLWIGVAASILVFLPNFIWQVRHGFISLDFLSYLHARDLRQGRYNGFFREQLWIVVNLVTAPLAVLGLWFYLFRGEAVRYRPLGWTFVASFALFALRGSRSYYTAPLYPMLLAAGSVWFGELLGRLRPAWSRLAWGFQWTAVFLGGAMFALLVMPVAPIGSTLWRITSQMHDLFREEIGWRELAESVSSVYQNIPPPERARTGILAGNYGEGGALNLYGPELGLPHAMCLTNSFWYRGYDPRLPASVIVLGFDLDEARKLFASCVVAAKNSNPFGVQNEESRNHPDILLCRDLRMAWPDYWRRFRRFG
jgi:hypothetical protein